MGCPQDPALSIHYYVCNIFSHVCHDQLTKMFLEHCRSAKSP
jgi:hypothetical protein